MRGHAMNFYGRPDDNTAVLRQRLAALASQLSELEDLRARVLEAEQIVERNRPEQDRSRAALIVEDRLL